MHANATEGNQQAYWDPSKTAKGQRADADTQSQFKDQLLKVSPGDNIADPANLTDLRTSIPESLLRDWEAWQEKHADTLSEAHQTLGTLVLAQSEHTVPKHSDETKASVEHDALINDILEHGLKGWAEKEQMEELEKRARVQVMSEWGLSAKEVEALDTETRAKLEEEVKRRIQLLLEDRVQTETSKAATDKTGAV